MTTGLPGTFLRIGAVAGIAGGPLSLLAGQFGQLNGRWAPGAESYPVGRQDAWPAAVPPG